MALVQVLVPIKAYVLVDVEFDIEDDTENEEIFDAGVDEAYQGSLEHFPLIDPEIDYDAVRNIRMNATRLEDTIDIC